MAKASIFWDTSIQAYRLKMTADYYKVEKCVAFLKQQIPASERELVVKELNGRKDYTWTFTEKYLQGTVDFMNLIYGKTEVVCVTRAQVEAAQQPRNTPVHAPSTSAQICYEFMKAIPYEAARQAYRKAAMLLHPDVNKAGDMGDMSQVNALWTKIEKEIYNQ